MIFALQPEKSVRQPWLIVQFILKAACGSMRNTELALCWVIESVCASRVIIFSGRVALLLRSAEIQPWFVRFVSDCTSHHATGAAK